MSKFGKLVGALKHKKHPPKNPAAVAYKAGVAKFGKKTMAKKAVAGKKRAARKGK